MTPRSASVAAVPLRVLLVTRRFWPLLGGAETIMANLAEELVRRGHSASILTAAWRPDWPSEIHHRHVLVRRIAQPSQRFIGTWRYMRGLRQWILKHQDEFDLAYVSMLKHDAYVMVRARGQHKLPVVLRVEGGGATGDVAWQNGNRFGGCIRAACRKASAIVAPSPAIEQELTVAGFDHRGLQFIPNGVAARPERNRPRRQSAREALGTAHPVLSLGKDTTLAVYVGRLSAEKGLPYLVDAWSQVLRQRGNTRLWIVGDGPERDNLAIQIERLKLRGRAVLIGSFDSVEELLEAADLFVLPSQEEGMSIALLEAMAAGLPIVATDIPGNRTLITDEVHGLLVPPRDAEKLALALSRLLDNPARGESLGAAARLRAQKDFSLTTMVNRHIELFREVVGRK